MRRIALVIPGLDSIGGAERQLLLMASGLRDRGWWVSIVCLSGSASAAINKVDDVEWVLLKMKHGLKDPAGWLRFVRWLRSEKPQVVHAHLPHAAWLARWSRLVAPVRVQLDTIHTSATGSWGRRVGYRISNWLPDCVSAVSKTAAGNWLQAHMVSEKQLLILPNGIEVSEQPITFEQREAARQRLGLAENFEWLAVGRLEAVKDYPTLLRGFAKLPPDAKLTIAGVGADEKALQRLSNKLGVQNRVRWLGFVDDLRPWLSAADAYVLSSLREGLPVGVLEAAAHGLPVVATDAAGVRDALPENCSEWITPVQDSESLASTMLRMMKLKDEERCAEGEKNYKFVRENFSLNQILDRWEELYNKLLAEQQQPRRWRR